MRAAAQALEEPERDFLAEAIQEDLRGLLGAWRAWVAARLAALYNESGLLALMAGEPQAAVTYLEQARRWASEVVPEDRGQKAAALVNLYAAQLALEERPAALQPLAEEAEAAAWAGPYWQHLARLELERARASAREADSAGVLAHVGNAVDYAARVDRQLAGALLGEAAVLLQGLGESERARGMAELVERLAQAQPGPAAG